MYKTNRDTYNQTAKFWTETYAQVRQEDEVMMGPDGKYRLEKWVLKDKREIRGASDGQKHETAAYACFSRNTA